MSPFPHLSTGPTIEHALAKVKGEAVFSKRGRRHKNPSQIYTRFYINAEKVKKGMGSLVYLLVSMFGRISNT